MLCELLRDNRSLKVLKLGYDDMTRKPDDDTDELVSMGGRDGAGHTSEADLADVRRHVQMHGGNEGRKPLRTPLGLLVGDTGRTWFGAGSGKAAGELLEQSVRGLSD